MKQIFSIIATLILVGVGVGVGIMQASKNSAIGKANHLKDEGNAARAAAAKVMDEAVPKFNSLFAVETLTEFPNNRMKMEATAKEASDGYVRTAEQYRLAAAKFDEGSKHDIDKSVAEYFSVWSQASAKEAERADAHRELVGHWLDPQIDDLEKLNALVEAFKSRRDGINSAIAELQAKAEKIQKDNASKFE